MSIQSPNMSELVSRSYKFWNYAPSIPAAVIFMLIFMVLTGLHSWKMFRARTWFCIAFTLGGFFQIIGYIGRCIAHNNTVKMGPYIIANVFILLSPTLFAATIYMTLGRVIRRVRGEHLSPIRVSRLTKTFVWFDVLSFVIQGNSSSLSVLGYPQWGKVCVIAGLAIQLISFTLFWVTAIIFAKRLRHTPTPECLKPGIPWQRSMHMLYAVSALILVRSIFRIIEYVMDNDGYPLMHEWTLYVFDSLPMVAVMVIFFIWYPDQMSLDADSDGNIPLAHVYSRAGISHV